MPLDAGFLAMLTMAGVWTPATGTDMWGNETLGAPVAVKCFVTSQTAAFGSEDGHGTQETKSVVRAEVITDFLGINVGDRFALPTGVVGYVTAVDTPMDENGINLMHTITVGSSKKG